jgi:hypothetical protein
MAADAWLKWNGFPEYMGDSTIDMDADAFLTALFTSGLTPNAETQDVLADIVANEVAGGTGYTRYTMTETWTGVTSTVTFDSDDPNWTASGGSITARYGVIFDDTPAAPTDPLVCYSLLDNAPADVVVTDGNTLTIEINASGIFTVTGM